MRSAARCSDSNGSSLGGAQLPGRLMHSAIAAAVATPAVPRRRLFVSHPCRGACRGGRVQAGVPRSNEPSGHSLHFQGGSPFTARPPQCLNHMSRLLFAPLLFLLLCVLTALACP